MGLCAVTRLSILFPNNSECAAWKSTSGNDSSIRSISRAFVESANYKRKDQVYN